MMAMCWQPSSSSSAWDWWWAAAPGVGGGGDEKQEEQLSSVPSQFTIQAEAAEGYAEQFPKHCPLGSSVCLKSVLAAALP